MNRALPALLLAAAPAWGAPPVRVLDAWARATAPGQSVSVLYFSALSEAGDTLLGAEAAGAEMAMLHRGVSHDGMAGMEDVERVALPPGRVVTLAPGGLHVMLMGLAKPLRAGGTVAVTLHFEKAGDVRLAAPVRPLGTSGK